jgi:hypothetical protein
MRFRVTAYLFCLLTFSAPFPALSATKPAPEAAKAGNAYVRVACYQLS